MKLNFSYFFIKAIACTYIIGLIVLLLVLVSFGGIYILWLVTYGPSFVPLAGFFGIIPIQILILTSELGKIMVVGKIAVPSYVAYLLFYSTLIASILLQYMLVKRLFKAISSKMWYDISFKIVFIHYLSVGVVSLTILRRTTSGLGLNWYGAIINLSVAFLLVYGIKKGG